MYWLVLAGAFAIFRFDVTRAKYDPAILRNFPAYDYYWPMASESAGGKVGNQKRMKNVPNDLAYKSKLEIHNNAHFINVSRIGMAVRLSGQEQYIDEVSGMVDCLTFRFASCDERAIAVEFWVRMRGGKRVFATGAYTNATHGPGILMEYDEHREELSVEFASSVRVWKTKIMVLKHSWCFVHAQWQIERGLIVVIDGDMTAIQTDAKGTEVKAKTSKFNKMITIGRPPAMSDKKAFGNFDIAHLVIYFRFLTNEEIAGIPKQSLEQPSLQDQKCCEDKENHECYTCSSNNCQDFERDFTNCICLNLKHRKCKAKTTVPPTPRADCVKAKDGVTLNAFGCNNVVKDNIPFCGGEPCYHGTCNEAGQCECPVSTTCDNVTMTTVCGSDGTTYESFCVLAMVSCWSKKEIQQNATGRCGSPLDDSAYYWSMKTFVRNPEGEEVTRDVKAEEELILFNGVEKTKTEDLGQVLVLDGKKSWISLSTTKTENLLILKKSLTLGFWMKYESGDTIMAAGAYVDALRSPGFRLRRDKKTNFFFLDVKGSSWSGRVVIERFPTNWFHFLFTWDKENGLKLYIDGKHMLSSKGRSGDFSYSEKRSGLNKLQFGRSRHHMYTRGNFSLGHVVIWDEALDADRVKSVYKTSIILTRHKMCCYLKQHTCHRNVSEYEGCICSKHDEYLQKHIDTKCKPATLTDLNAFCGDESDHCDILIKGQEGYCTNFRSYAKKSCRSSCEIPCIRTVPLVGPSKHFTEKTLIFSILGCIGGLMLLLGVTVYFWKVYRTRCFPTATKGRDFLL